MIAGGKTVPSYHMTPETVGLCLGMMLAVGLIAAIWPVLHLSRMTTLDGLRHSG